MDELIYAPSFTAIELHRGVVLAAQSWWDHMKLPAYDWSQEAGRHGLDQAVASGIALAFKAGAMSKAET